MCVCSIARCTAALDPQKEAAAATVTTLLQLLPLTRRLPLSAPRTQSKTACAWPLEQKHSQRTISCCWTWTRNNMPIQSESVAAAAAAAVAAAVPLASFGELASYWTERAQAKRLYVGVAVTKGKHDAWIL